jgi:hypothetical protein
MLELAGYREAPFHMIPHSSFQILWAYRARILARLTSESLALRGPGVLGTSTQVSKALSVRLVNKKMWK